MVISGGAIETLEGLLVHLELHDNDELTDWLEEQLWDPVAVFQLCEDDGSFCVDGVSASLLQLDGYTIDITFPFGIEQFYEEVGAAVAHFDAHASAAVLIGRPLGASQDGDDATAELADWAGVFVDDLVAILGGRWEPCHEFPELSATGTIYGWWVRQAEPAVAMGVGGTEVYVDAVRRDDGKPTLAVENPDPTDCLRADRSDEAGAREWLALLRAAIDQAGGSASARSR